MLKAVYNVLPTRVVGGGGGGWGNSDGEMRTLPFAFTKVGCNSVAAFASFSES